MGSSVTALLTSMAFTILMTSKDLTKGDTIFVFLAFAFSLCTTVFLENKEELAYKKSTATGDKDGN